MPKQIFDVYDYLGPLVAALVFALLVLLISFFVLNFLFVRQSDDLTCFERFGSRHNLRLGPHSLQHVKRSEANLQGYEEELLGNSSAEPTSTMRLSGRMAINQTPSPPSIRYQHHSIPKVTVDAASNSWPEPIGD